MLTPQLFHGKLIQKISTPEKRLLLESLGPAIVKVGGAEVSTVSTSKDFESMFNLDI